MDINAIVTKKEVHFRNVIWRMGQPHPITLDTCYTPWGFLFPMADNFAVLEMLKRGRLDVMGASSDGYRGAIITHDNEFFALRFYDDMPIYSRIGEECRLYTVSEDAHSNSVSAAINMMNSELTHPDFQCFKTPKQIIKIIEKNYPNVGDYMMMKRPELIAELKRRHPKAKTLPLLNDLAGKK